MSQSLLRTRRGMRVEMEDAIAGNTCHKKKSVLELASRKLWTFSQVVNYHYLVF
jgi:hypothetical protein